MSTPLLRRSSKTDGTLHWTNVCGVLLVAAGIFLRIGQYLFNRSLFIDEAALALNVRDRTALELLSHPLEGAQTGAPLFILLLRGLVVLFGDGELVLRLPAAVSGVLAVLLFYHLAGKLVPQPWHLVATFLFALNFPLTYHSADVKPYSIDVLASVWVILAVLPLRSGGLTRHRAIHLTWIGAVMAGVSQPAALVLAATLTLLAASSFMDRDWQSLKCLGMVAIAWAVASGVTLWYSRRALGDEGFDYMNRYWSDAFLPFPPTSAEHLWAYYLSALGFGISPIGSMLPGVLVFALIGVIALCAYDRWVLALLVGPIAVTVLASIAKRYPFRSTVVGEWPQGRVVLFLAPAVILLIGYGLALLWESRFKWQRRIVVGTSGLVLAGNLTLFSAYPVRREELRPVLAEVDADFGPSDFLYLYYGAHFAYRYYEPRLTIPRDQVYFGRCGRGQPGVYIEDLMALRGSSRVWVVASHSYQNEVNYLFDVLRGNSVNVRTVEGFGAVAGLFDLRLLPSDLSAAEHTSTDDTSEAELGCSGIHDHRPADFGETERRALSESAIVR